MGEREKEGGKEVKRKRKRDLVLSSFGNFGLKILLSSFLEFELERRNGKIELKNGMKLENGVKISWEVSMPHNLAFSFYNLDNSIAVSSNDSIALLRKTYLLALLYKI